MARIDWIEHRLQNWARWKLGRGSGTLGYAQVNLASPTPGVRDPYAEVPVPTNAIEASETDDAVALLTGELRATVIQYYTGPGGVADHLRRLCCAPATLHARLGRAHRQLADHFTARKDRASAERLRVEHLQQASRPLDVDIGPVKRRRRQGSFTK